MFLAPGLSPMEGEISSSNMGLYHMIASFPWVVSAETKSHKGHITGHFHEMCSCRGTRKKDGAERKLGSTKVLKRAEKDLRSWKAISFTPFEAEVVGFPCGPVTRHSLYQSGMVLSRGTPSTLWQFQRTEAFPTTGGKTFISEGKSGCHMVSTGGMMSWSKSVNQKDTLLRSVAKHPVSKQNQLSDLLTPSS